MGLDEYDYATVDDEASIAEAAQLLSMARSKDAATKALKRAVQVLEGCSQSEALQKALKPLTDEFLRPSLLENQDKGIRIYMAACVVHSLRISAPLVPYEDDAMESLFGQVLQVFELLRDPSSASYRVCVSILSVFAKVKCGLLLWDLGDGSMVNQLFRALLYSVNLKNEVELKSHILETLSYMVEEADEIPQGLIDVLLECLETPEGSPPRTRLVQSLLRRHESSLRVPLQMTLTSIIESGGRPYHNHYNLLLAVQQAVPQLLLPVLPHLCPLLEAEEESQRLAAVEVAGHLFSNAEPDIAGEYPELLSFFLRRFLDQKVDVRLRALSFAKGICSACSSFEQKSQVLKAAAARQLDIDDRLRAYAISAICEIGIQQESLLTSETLKTALGRLLDAKASVRKAAGPALGSLFRSSVRNIAEGTVADINDAVLRIPGALLVHACCDPDKSVRSSHENILEEGLLPANIPAEDAAKVWAEVTAATDDRGRRALVTFLSRKQGFHEDFVALLRLRQTQHQQASVSAGTQQSTAGDSVIQRLAATMPDPIRASDGLKKLLILKDNRIFRGMEALAARDCSPELFERTSADLLRRVGARGSQREVVSLMLRRLKCSLFHPSYLKSLIGFVSDEEAPATDPTANAATDLLFLVISADPKLFEGLLEPLVALLECSSPQVVCLACKALALVGQPAMTTRSRMQLEATTLEKAVSGLTQICSTGTAKAAKFAGKALAVLVHQAGGLSESKSTVQKLLTLLDEAESGWQHSITVLRALSGFSRAAPDAFAPFAGQVVEFVMEVLMKVPKVSPPPGASKEHRLAEGWNHPCPEVLMKEAAIKLLGKALAPDQESPKALEALQEVVVAFIEQLDSLLEPSNGMEDYGIRGDASEGRMRLSAACAMLRLARRHGHLFLPQTYTNLALTAQDPVMEVRAAFIPKVVKTAYHFEGRRQHSTASKYMAMLSLCAVDPATANCKRASEELRSFVAARRQAVYAASLAAACSSADAGGCNLPDQPEFMLPYTVYLLAHHPDLTEEIEVYGLRPWEKMLSFILERLLEHEGLGAAEHGSSLPAICKTLLTLKLSGDVLAAGVNDKICLISDLGIALCGGAARLSKLPPFPAKVPLPRSLYQPVDKTETMKNRKVGSHLPQNYRVSRVLEEVDPAGSARQKSRTTLQKGRTEAGRGGKRKQREAEIRPADTSASSQATGVHSTTQPAEPKADFARPDKKATPPTKSLVRKKPEPEPVTPSSTMEMKRETRRTRALCSIPVTSNTST